MPGPLFHDLTPEEEALARSYFLRQGMGPKIRARQQELAALAGASRETVTRALQELKAQGAVRLAPGVVEVLSPALLEEVAFGLV
jgi:CRP/FNR family transcriptional regulator